MFKSMTSDYMKKTGYRLGLMEHQFVILKVGRKESNIYPASLI